MREILFRGKRVDNGEWVYGNLVEWLNETKDVSIIAHPFGCCIDEVGNLVLIEEPFVCKVHPETVGQYTGFTDQNKNKIFEGDILELSGSYEEVDGTSVDCIEHYEVKYKNAAFYACSVEHKVMLSEIVSSMEIIDSLTIIGNIHESED
jgi:uncharacterized phage protein (TIGR01671 family)